MGAVPKKQPSHTRKHTRRSAWMRKAQDNVAPTLVACPKCNEMHIPHRVCKQCGFYNDKLVLEPEAQVKRAE